MNTNSKLKNDDQLMVNVQYYEFSQLNDENVHNSFIIIITSTLMKMRHCNKTRIQLF